MCKFKITGLRFESVLFKTLINVICHRMLILKKEMNEWTHVILGEVHEREEDMDLVMLICKKLLLTNSRGTKLILMLATMKHLTSPTTCQSASWGCQHMRRQPS